MDARSVQPRGVAERMVLTSAGGLLAWYGIRRGGLGGLGAVALGSYLAYRGIASRSAILRLRDFGEAGEARLEVLPRAATPAAPPAETVRIHRSIVVGRPAGDLYAFWRDPRNLPRVFPFLSEVTATDQRRSHWRLAAPGGLSAEWDSVIEREEPGRAIEWRSVDPAALPNRGTVEFQSLSGGRETQVLLAFEFEPPAGELGRELAAGLDVGALISDGLRRFREELERPVPRPLTGD